ncbi:transcription initiation factor TFIID subunit 1-like [Centruroides sculpturatus]|uniref:transcription initiation factor TFIID subunit 1-like n=1 Tax=Centruroides sculpturatus TaxID=218467 RepID=UPI000C6CF8BF|nr:transcription initiation factor TFIID subunit 1-like [Centruroides sculpturatus]
MADTILLDEVIDESYNADDENDSMEKEFKNDKLFTMNYSVDTRSEEVNQYQLQMEMKSPIIEPAALLSKKTMTISDYYKPSKKNVPNIWGGVRKRNSKRGIEKHQLKVVEENLLIESDEEEKFCQSEKEVQIQIDETFVVPDSESISSWRFGAAEYWFNLLNIPANSKKCNYGFNLKDDDYDEEIIDDIPLENYLMVNQLQWEDDVIWDGEVIKNRVLQNMKKNNTPYWAQKMLRPKQQCSLTNLCGQQDKRHENRTILHKVESFLKNDDGSWYSNLPVENQDLLSGEWEKDVIWNCDEMTSLPEPNILTLDLNDENIIMEMPHDTIEDSIKQEQILNGKISNGKKDVWKFWKKEIIAPYELPIIQKDSFNISNDEYYNPKCIQNYNLRSNEGIIIQHSIPALELHPAFYPPNITEAVLRNFHRPVLKPYYRGPLSKSRSHEVIFLKKHIKQVAEMREREREASGGGDMFFMRTINDLSSKDGKLIFAEYSEEFPPLMMNIGMATKIKNYYRRRPGKEIAPTFKYGEPVQFIHTSPFLGHLKQGQSLQAFENNLFRAPLYEHQMPNTDFLIIRTQQGYYIREVDTIYVVGQELPLMEVPGPKSKNSYLFTKEFLQVFIYRLFKMSTDHPPRCKLEDIKRAFPCYSESSIRKRLNHCAEFKRTGINLLYHLYYINLYILKISMTVEKIEIYRSSIGEGCLNARDAESLPSAWKYLDAGYGEKLIFTEDENEEDFQGKIDDEIKAAPWNTTRAFIMAMKGKCCLEINGVADPTGCGEGFSYVRLPNKSLMSVKDENNAFPKKPIVGTDADLRKMSQKKGIQLLRSCGCSIEETKDLSRWEVLHLIRVLTSNEENMEESELKKYARKPRPTITDQLEKYAKECQRIFEITKDLSRWEVLHLIRVLTSNEENMEESELKKYARKPRPTITDQLEKYAKECQRIFEIQNKVLSSNEILSTDENSTDEDDDDSDIEEMGRNIENILADKKTCKQISEEQEEIQRQELQKLMNKDTNKLNKKNKLKNEETTSKELITDESYEGKILEITRTYKTLEGKLFNRVETVKKPEIISRYIHIKTAKDSELARKVNEDLEKEKRKEIRKEKKRLQDKLRRINRNQERGFYEIPAKRPKKELIPSNMKCGACGVVGHIRTNKICPMYQPQPSAVRIAMTEEEEKEASDVLNENALVKVEDTKLVLSKKFMERMLEVRKKTMRLTFRKDVIDPKKGGWPRDYAGRKCEERRNSALSVEETFRPAANNRCVRNPVVSLSTVFQEIWQKMRNVLNSNPFWFPVKSHTAPDYYKIVSSPMDLSRIKHKLQELDYRNREEFLDDVCQIVKNSSLYNGEYDVLTSTAKEMLKICVDEFQKNEERLMSLEEAINHDSFNDNVTALSYILTGVVDKHLRTIPECWPFLQPCNKKYVRDLTNGETPMCLQIISENIKKLKYRNGREFFEDVEKIWKDSRAIRGEDSQFTKKAKEIVDACARALEKYREKLRKVEVPDDRDEEISDFYPEGRKEGGNESDQLARDLHLSPDNSEEEDDDDFDPRTTELRSEVVF